LITTTHYSQQKAEFQNRGMSKYFSNNNKSKACSIKQVFFLSIKLLFYFTITLLAQTAKSQSAKSTLEYAHFSYDNSNFKEAIKQTKRVIFFSGDEFQTSTYILIANSYFQLFDYKNAAKYYGYAKFYAQTDSLKNEYILKNTKAYILATEYSLAHTELSLLKIKNNSYLTPRKRLIEAVLLFKEEKYQRSEELFIQLVDSNSSQCHEIASLFNQKFKLNHPKRKTATVLSRIIPGMGQTYSGDFKNGINSTALLGLIGYSGVRIATTYSILDAVLAVSPWFWRYYIGGIRKTAFIAENKRNQNKAEILAKILKQIEIYEHSK